MNRATLLKWWDGPVRSWLVSQLYGLWAIVVFAVSLEFASGSIHGFSSLAQFLLSEPFWFSVFMAIIIGVGPYARAKQGADRQANTVQLADGVTAVVTKPKAT